MDAKLLDAFSYMTAAELAAFIIGTRRAYCMAVSTVYAEQALAALIGETEAKEAVIKAKAALDALAL